MGKKDKKENDFSDQEEDEIYYEDLDEEQQKEVEKEEKENLEELFQEIIFEVMTDLENYCKKNMLPLCENITFDKLYEFLKKNSEIEVGV